VICHIHFPKVGDAKFRVGIFRVFRNVKLFKKALSEFLGKLEIRERVFIGTMGQALCNKIYDDKGAILTPKLFKAEIEDEVEDFWLCS